jgi:hypothetical protein
VELCNCKSVLASSDDPLYDDWDDWDNEDDTNDGDDYNNDDDVTNDDVDNNDDTNDKEIKYSFDNVEKNYEEQKITQSKGLTIQVESLDDGATNVHSFEISKEDEYKIGFAGEESYGNATIQLEDSTGNILIQEDISLAYQEWSKKVTLPKGKYQIKVLSKCSWGLEYNLFVKSCNVKRTEELKLDSCDYKELKPGVGEGDWKTSDSKIVSIVGKTKSKSVCEVWAKKPGTATITYTNKAGSEIKYKITVSDVKTYPFYDAGFKMDDDGGLKVYVTMSNNSNKKIKSASLTISFYNDANKKLSSSTGNHKGSFNITFKDEKIGSWESKVFDWTDIFWNYYATKIKVENVKVIYTDGTTKTIKVNKKFGHTS